MTRESRMEEQGGRSGRAAELHAADLVRRFDPDRHLAAGLAPPDVRTDLLAVAAFNLEVAKIPEVVREPMMGTIRHQWWREAVGEIYEGRPRAHAVVTALAGAVERRGLARADLEAVIEAREADLETEGHRDMESLVAYVDATAGRIAALQLTVIGGAAPGVRSVLAAGVRGWALVGLMRAIPDHVRLRRIHLPEDVRAEHAVAASTLAGREPRSALAGAVGTVLDRAEAEFAMAAAARPERRLRPVAAFAAIGRHHLRRLRRAGDDPYAPELRRPAGLLPVRLAADMALRRL